MNLPRVSIRWPVAVAMVCAVIIVLGFIALGDTPLDMMPEMEFPVVAIMTTYEGAGPREVENLVTRPIEEAVARLSGLESVQSISSRGSSTVVAQFQWGTNMDFAALDVREAVDMIRGLLPSDADTPLVLKFDPSMIPVMAITLGGDMTPAQLRDFAEDVVQPRLERLQGVASVGVTGGLEREIQVVLHPGRMQAHGVTVEQVTRLLQAENVDSPGGTGTWREREYIVRTSGEFQSLQEIADLEIPVASGASVPLRHVADVRDTFKDPDIITRLNFEPAVGISVQKEDGANTVQVARRVRQALEGLKREYGDQVETVVVFDQGERIEESLRSVAENGIMGAIMAALVLFVFLRNVRAVFVVVTAIPLSIVASFVLLYFAGMSLNIISLGGLALGVGMLVDNAIVVLENVYRHRSEGAPAEKAAEEGANEVGMAIFAATLTTVAVFLPVLFIQGIARQIFQDMAVTVSFTLTASLLVALTVVPLLAARWLRTPVKAGSGGTGSGGAASGGNEGAAVEHEEQQGRWFATLRSGYARALAWSLQRRGLVLAVVGAAFIGSFALVPRIGAEFMPQVDHGSIAVDIELPVGSLREQTERVAREFEERLYALPEVEHVYVRIGSTSSAFMPGGAMPERAGIQVTLVPVAERQRSVFDIVEVIRRWGEDVPGATVAVQAETGVMMSSGAPIEVELRGEDEEALQAAVELVADAVRAVPGTREVTTSLQDERPEYRIALRRERARQLGLTVPQVASLVRTAIDGQVATYYRTGGDEIDVRVFLETGAEADLETLRHVPIATSAAGLVPLGDVVEFLPGSSPRDLERRNQGRTMTVSAHLFQRDLGAVMADVRAALAELPIPADVEVNYEGEAQQMQEAFGDLSRALVLAVFLVYAVLASQFNSFRYPLVIMFTVPLAAIGVILGLFVTGHRLSVSAFIGLIMLAGIVVNNGIVLVDYVNLLRSRGVPRREALVEAGRTRLRPVLMTTLTTVLGLVPLALGIGEGAEMQAPMAVVVIAGLTFSTVLTLVVVPIMYEWIDDFGLRAWKMRRRKLGVEEAAAGGQ